MSDGDGSIVGGENGGLVGGESGGAASVNPLLAAVPEVSATADEESDVPAGGVFGVSRFARTAPRTDAQASTMTPAASAAASGLILGNEMSRGDDAGSGIFGDHLIDDSLVDDLFGGATAAPAAPAPVEADFAAPIAGVDPFGAVPAPVDPLAGTVTADAAAPATAATPPVDAASQGVVGTDDHGALGADAGAAVNDATGGHGAVADLTGGSDTGLAGHATLSGVTGDHGALSGVTGDHGALSGVTGDDGAVSHATDSVTSTVDHTVSGLHDTTSSLLGGSGSSGSDSGSDSDSGSGSHHLVSVDAGSDSGSDSGGDSNDGSLLSAHVDDDSGDSGHDLSSSLSSGESHDDSSDRNLLERRRRQRHLVAPRRRRRRGPPRRRPGVTPRPGPDDVRSR